MTGRNLPVVPKPGSAVSAKQAAEIERQVWEALPHIDDIDVLEAGRRNLAALVAYLRAPELQRPALSAQRGVEARIGQLLGPAEHGGDRRSATAQTDQPNHDEVDLSDPVRSDFRVLAKALDGEVEVTPEEWQKSRRALTALVRLRAGEMPKTPELPDGQFRCIVADPPWKMDTGPGFSSGSASGDTGHDALTYDQMTVEAIKALDVESLAADDAHLYLWTTNRYVEAAYDVARAWGFKPSVLLVWAKKPQGVGLGDTYRLTTEFVLFARRGNLEHRQIIPRSWFDWPRGKHSVKPAAFFEMVESVTPGPALEMFARAKRKDWTVWGAEADD
jgi:N6-adenosine-specific RNA methylase IME4